MSVATELAAAARHLAEGRPREAEAICRGQLQNEPDNLEALHALAFALCQQGRLEEGLSAFLAAAGARPATPASHTGAGYVLLELRRAAEALTHFQTALRLAPRDVDALKGQGLAHAALGRQAEAAESYRAALAVAPADPEIHYNLGNALLAEGSSVEAGSAYAEALRLRPAFPEALNNRGAALWSRDRRDEAYADFVAAVRLRPAFPDAWRNIGDYLTLTGRGAEAVAAYDRALQLHPDSPYTQGASLLASLSACDWSAYQERAERIHAGALAGQRVAVPLVYALTSSDPQLLRRGAEIWVSDRFPAAQPLWQGRSYEHNRIRVAYLSADLHEHPVGYCLAGVLERHDRTRFETVALSLRPDPPGSAMRRRLRQAVEHFIDVSDTSDARIAARVRELEIDILVDLTGHTDGGRTAVLARRAAPVQVNFLGYPATMGADYVDYVLADRTVLPEMEQCHFRERPVYLSPSYLPNDYRALAAPPACSRAEAGLPEHGAVLCAFNNTSKITPQMFAVWMRLLQRVPHSVLWLSARSREAALNLGRRAVELGVAPERLVFAPRLATLEAHLGRQALADLFLDTCPYGAHTTAADALWGCVPVVTCAGSTMAGRAAASLLNALGLAELVTSSLAQYEALALRLATDVAARTALRQRLEAARASHALYDADRYTRHLLMAYEHMHARSRAGVPPQAFAVQTP